MNKLIYGKSQTPRIVAIETADSSAELFIQNPDGSVSSKFIEHDYWLLSHSNIDGSFAKLSGDLHFKWGKQFSNRKDWGRCRYLWRDHDIYTIYNSVESLMVKDGYCYYQGMKPEEVSLLSFDLETTTLDPNDKDAKIILISTTARNHNGTITRKLFSYDDFTSQSSLIDSFSLYVQHINPSLLVGHNIIAFDFKYLHTIASKSGTSLKLGRDGSNATLDSYTSKFRLDGTRNLEYQNVRIYGREIIDTFFLSMKFDVSKAIESYALKPMIKQLGLEKDGRQYYDASKIRTNYKIPEEFAKIKQYAIEDSDDAIKLWDKFGPLFFHMAPMIPKRFSSLVLTASGSQINALMVRAYLQDGHSIPKADQIERFDGALSWGKPGIYRNVLKVDCAAMYPNIILQYNVYDPDKDPHAYLLVMVREFLNKRLEYKKKATESGLQEHKNLDDSAKAVLNSFYGFLGARGCNFNSAECAEFITEKGREILSHAIIWATGKKFEELAPEYFENENNEEEVEKKKA